MKNLFKVLLCACLVLSVSVGCGNAADAAPEEEKAVDEVKIYPEYIDAFIDTTDIGEAPEIIYTTPASENGLEGELYRIEGEVTESAAAGGEEGETVGSFTVQTDLGEISIIDPSMMLSEYGAEYGGFADEILQKYFTVPQVGERVCVYVEYLGYSELLHRPACYYGGQDYVEKTIVSMMVDNGYSDEQEEVAEEGQLSAPEPDAAEEQKKIAKTARTICAENYASTSVSNITVNENLGTDTEGDYVLLAELTWDVKNSKDTTKEMLAMYSEDFAARVGEDLKNVSEVTVFWTVPHYSKTDTAVKYTYTRQDDGMYQTDAMVSAFLN